MIILENITNFLETFLIRTIYLVLHTSLNFLKEIFKFVLILVLIYYFAFWTFRLWHPNLEYDPKTLNARIGKPDGSLVKRAASLIEQLEIEAEFEVNKKKIVRLKPDIVAKDSDEGAIPKIEFISLVEHKQNKTSRPTQTKKTSLGKKSKLRDKSNQINMNKKDKTVKKIKAVKIDNELPTQND